MLQYIYLSLALDSNQCSSLPTGRLRHSHFSNAQRDEDRRVYSSFTMQGKTRLHVVASSDKIGQDNADLRDR